MVRAVPILPGDDLSIAKALYVDGLGFQTRFEVTEDAGTGSSAWSAARST